MRGYAIGDVAGVDAKDGDALIHALIERGGQDSDWLTEGQLSGNPIRLPAKDYRDWFATLPTELTDAVVAHWGPPPGELFVDRSHDRDGEIVIAALQAGNVVLMVQPPRGFGENPVAIYHDPDLPPSHHYLAAYHWIAGADARGGKGGGFGVGRLEQYGAGRCMDFETDGPSEIAAAIAEEIGREVDYRPVETDGAVRAAGLIAELL